MRHPACRRRRGQLPTRSRGFKPLSILGIAVQLPSPRDGPRPPSRSSVSSDLTPVPRPCAFLPSRTISICLPPFGRRGTPVHSLQSLQVTLQSTTQPNPGSLPYSRGSLVQASVPIFLNKSPPFPHLLEATSNDLHCRTRVPRHRPIPRSLHRVLQQELFNRPILQKVLKSRFYFARITLHQSQVVRAIKRGINPCRSLRALPLAVPIPSPFRAHLAASRNNTACHTG